MTEVIDGGDDALKRRERARLDAKIRYCNIQAPQPVLPGSQHFNMRNLGDPQQQIKTKAHDY